MRKTASRYSSQTGTDSALALEQWDSSLVGAKTLHLLQNGSVPSIAIPAKTSATWSIISYREMSIAINLNLCWKYFSQRSLQISDFSSGDFRKEKLITVSRWDFFKKMISFCCSSSSLVLQVTTDRWGSSPSLFVEHNGDPFKYVITWENRIFKIILLFFYNFERKLRTKAQKYRSVLKRNETPMKVSGFDCAL